jgi:hypothetical protein
VIGGILVGSSVKGMLVGLAGGFPAPLPFSDEVLGRENRSEGS